VTYVCSFFYIEPGYPVNEMDLPSPMAVLWFLATIVDCIICQLQNAKESILLISGYISGANFYFSVVVQHLSVTHQSLSNVSLVFFKQTLYFTHFSS
jgi:hypothetical protein